MNAITYYSKAIKKVDSGEITIGEYERMINVLRDVEPVVRCRDCLHNCACEIQYHAQAGDLFFCGAAERKDGDNG